MSFVTNGQKTSKWTPEKAAFVAGKDCVLSGPNTSNCHFRHFATPQQTRAWEQGKAEGDAAKA
jgi:hypothetical protein